MIILKEYVNSKCFVLVDWWQHCPDILICQERGFVNGTSATQHLELLIYVAILGIN